MNSVSMLNSGLRLLSLACLVLAVTSCGADANDPKGPFGPHTPSTVVVFKGTSMNGSVPDLTATRNETVTINGRTFTKLKVTPAGASSEAFSVFANYEPDVVEFGGGELFWNGNPSATPGVPFVSGAPDSPIVVNLDPPTGEDQTVEVKGTVYAPDPSSPHAIDTVGTYRAVAKDVTVQTSMGPVAPNSLVKSPLRASRSMGTPSIIRTTGW